MKNLPNGRASVSAKTLAVLLLLGACWNFLNWKEKYRSVSPDAKVMISYDVYPESDTSEGRFVLRKNGQRILLAERQIGLDFARVEIVWQPDAVTYFHCSDGLTGTYDLDGAGHLPFRVNVVAEQLGRRFPDLGCLKGRTAADRVWKCYCSPEGYKAFHQAYARTGSIELQD